MTIESGGLCMKTVYWCDAMPNSVVTPALKPHTLPLAMSVVRPKDMFTQSLTQCPAWRERMKNTFVVPSPISFTFETSGDGGWRFYSSDIPDENAALMVEQNGAHTFQLQFSELMFCETPLVLSQEPPALIGGTFHKQVDFIGGEFDISKWFRPLSMAFQTLDDAPTSFSVARGDPLYFLRFHTTEAVQFKKFKMSPRLLELVGMFLASKNRASTARGTRPLNFFYELFTGRNTHVEVLSEIKKNLLPT
jgi:hypothetical protein